MGCAFFQGRDGLVRGVFAGDVAAPALDAQLLIDDGLVDVVQVEVAPVHHSIYRAALKIRDMAIAFFVHEVRQAADHVFDDAEAIDHGGGADLYVAAAQGDELGRVAPCRDAADSGDWQAGGFGIAGDFRNHVQGNGFDGGAAIAAVRAFSSGIRPHRHRIEVDADDGVDRVDQRYGIGTAFFGGASWVADIGDVRRQFHDDWQTRIVFAPARDHFDVFGNLSDGRAHSALAHAVRAAKVQFDSIGASVFDARHDVLP